MKEIGFQESDVKRYNILRLKEKLTTPLSVFLHCQFPALEAGI
jgi:hypothetical protein